jgi:DNA-binding GntR family transcriptional regulator
VSKHAVLELEPVKLDRRLPVVGQIFDYLRSRIISLQIEPGTSLSRPALSEHFNVSQTPIRDALLRLEQEGLVMVFPQSSTLVSLIDVAQAHEARFLRVALETEVCRTIALDPDRHDIATAERLLEDMRAIWEKTGEPQAMRPTDQAFHASLCATAGHPRLWDLVVQRSGNIDRLRSLNLYPGKAVQILEEHRALLDALKAGRVEEAQAVIRTHLSSTLRAVDQMRAAYPQYFAN